jgi:hypothetical protein
MADAGSAAPLSAAFGRPYQMDPTLARLGWGGTGVA